MNTHYICRGECGGTSDAPSVCGTEACSKNKQPFEACECTDGGHKEVPVVNE